MEEIESLVKSWVALHKAEHGSDDYQSNFWAFDSLIKLLFDDPNAGVDCIIEILNYDSSIVISENIAAGPLEDLLSFHGIDAVEILEKKIEKSPRLSATLGGVWQNSISNEVWSKFETIRSKKKW